MKTSCHEIQSSDAQRQLDIYWFFSFFLLKQLVKLSMKMDRRTVLMMLMLTVLARANQPPRFDGVSGGEIVLKLKEGPATPVGTEIYRIRGKDSDEGDVLQFGLQGQAANELLRVQPVGDHEADLILIKELDREVCLFF